MEISERSERAAEIARQYRGEVNGKANELPTAAVMEAMFPDYHDMTEEYLLADVMSRPGLSLRERSMIIIVTLMVIRFEGGLKGHMKWALNVGLTRQEVAEAILLTCRYGGWPDGEELIQLLNEVYPGFLKEGPTYALEKIWAHPGLTNREQHMITIAAYVALRFGKRLKNFIDQVIDQSLLRNEILEIIIQVTPFSGWPVGMEALRIVNEVFSLRK